MKIIDLKEALFDLNIIIPFFLFNISNFTKDKMVIVSIGKAKCKWSLKPNRKSINLTQIMA